VSGRSRADSLSRVRTNSDLAFISAWYCSRCSSVSWSSVLVAPLLERSSFLTELSISASSFCRILSQLVSASSRAHDRWVTVLLDEGVVAQVVVLGQLASLLMKRGSRGFCARTTTTTSDDEKNSASLDIDASTQTRPYRLGRQRGRELVGRTLLGRDLLRRRHAGMDGASERARDNNNDERSIREKKDR